MDDGAAKRKIEKFILPLALIFPLALMTANLTYDEFWSLIRFAPLGAGVFPIVKYGCESWTVKKAER